MINYFKYFLLISFLFTITGFSFSQITVDKDSIKTLKSKDTIKRISQNNLIKDSTHFISFDTNRIKNTQRLDNYSDTSGYNTYIWNDKRNLGEILNEKPGYFINFLGNGGKNPINYNGINDNNVGIFRDGIQINDNFYGGFDIENISVNEIKAIEEVSNVSSFLFGINSQAKSINIITKDEFRPTLFSQLRYTQDRYDQLSADFYINMPFSKKINFIFGMNNYAYDGRYSNSDISVWRGRIKLNYYISPKINLKFSFYHTKNVRRLNEGLQYTTDDTLINPILANIISPDSYEKISNYYFDISLNAKLLKDTLSLTKLKFYEMNSLRLYRNGENHSSTGVFLKEDFHSMQYGIDLKQNIKKILFKNIYFDLLAGGNAYFNLYNFSVPQNPVIDDGSYRVFLARNYYTAMSKLDVGLYNFVLSGSYKIDYFENKLFNLFGLEVFLNLINNKEDILTLHGGVNSTTSGINYNSLKAYGITGNSGTFYDADRILFYELGVKCKFNNIVFDFYNNVVNKSIYDGYSNGNYSIYYNSKYIDAGLNATISNNIYLPDLFFKSDISYHNFFFKDNLNLRIGINIKYFNKVYLYNYSQEFYQRNYYGLRTAKDFFNVDFYIGARIGTANVNLTFANLFNKVNYTTAIYPYDDRGGLFNSLSRFSITWDFNR